MLSRSLKGRESTVETTNPINGNDLQAVADNLIIETPDNSENVSEEIIEEIDDDQTEVIEDETDEQDDVVAQDNDEDLGEEYEEAEESEAQKDSVYTVTVDGTETAVTFDELKRGYSGQKYIQKGMAENANSKQLIAQERQMLMQLVQQVQNGDVPVIPNYPSEELKNSDPLGYLEQEAEYRRAVDKRQLFDYQLGQQQQQQAQIQSEQNNQFLEQQAHRLAEWMPEFADPEKRNVIINDMSSKAKKHYKLTDEQIGTVKTAEEVRILGDALKWRELQANSGKAQKKAEGARPVVKPAAKRAASSGRVSKAKKAEATMRKSGSIDAVADFLLNP